jgi:hypothetical protein
MGLDVLAEPKLPVPVNPIQVIRVFLKTTISFPPHPLHLPTVTAMLHLPVAALTNRYLSTCRATYS